MRASTSVCKLANLSTGNRGSTTICTQLIHVTSSARVGSGCWMTKCSESAGASTEHRDRFAAAPGSAPERAASCSRPGSPAAIATARCVLPIPCGTASYCPVSTFEVRICKFGKPKLLMVDETGYLPFEPNATHLFFQLVSRRYERDRILITSNRSIG